MAAYKHCFLNVYMCACQFMHEFCLYNWIAHKSQLCRHTIVPSVLSPSPLIIRQSFTSSQLSTSTCYLEFICHHVSQPLVVHHSKEDISLKFPTINATVQPLVAIVVVAS